LQTRAATELSSHPRDAEGRRGLQIVDWHVRLRAGVDGTRALGRAIRADEAVVADEGSAESQSFWLKPCALDIYGVTWVSSEDRMTTRLDRAIDVARGLPQLQQDVLAALIEEFARNQEDGAYQLSDDEQRLLDEGLAELDRGERVPHNEIKELLAQYRR
jgi:predicted transcriptional regulator